ncbi:MAG: MFS transporter [Chloroflexi bacterium]|nr:MFS transporter [Chloroflexota bacterium]
MPPRPITLVSLVVALSLLGDSMLYAVLPTQYDAFGLPVVAVGLLLSANRYVRLVTNPLAGRLCDRVGIRVPFLGAVALGAGTTVTYGLAPGLAVFVVARLLWGTAWSLLRLGSYLTVLRYSSAGQLGRGMGAYNAISRQGSLVGMLAGGVLADLLGARPTLVLFGAISALGLLLAWPVHLDHVHASRAAPAPTAQADGAWLRFLRGEDGGPAGSQVASVHLAALWLGLAAGVIIGMIGYLLRVRFGERIEVLGLLLGVATLTGVVLASRWVAELAVAPLSGALADRFGRPVAGLAFTAVAVAGMALLGAGVDLTTVLAGAALAFVGSSALVVVLEAAAGDLAPPTRRAAAMSRYATWWDLGSACGPAFGYALVGSLGLATIYGLVALGLAAVMCTFAWASTRAARVRQTLG